MIRYRLGLEITHQKPFEGMVFRVEVMVKRGNWAYTKSIVRGEMLGSVEPELSVVRAFAKGVLIGQEGKLGV